MDLDSLTPAEIVAAHLALVVALVHLSLGMLNWIRWLGTGHLVPADVRWPLFVISGVAMLVAMPFATSDRLRRPLYAGGIGLMVVYVVGYFAWHAAGHRPLLFGGPGHHHDTLTFEFLLDHLFAGAVEFLAIATEVALALVLAYLLLTDSRRESRR